jgi:hypothetical protein
VNYDIYRDQRSVGNFPLPFENDQKCVPDLWLGLSNSVFLSLVTSIATGKTFLVPISNIELTQSRSLMDIH